MTRIQELREQAARAERLAKNILDDITVERLLKLADDCRQQMQTLIESEHQAA